MFDVTAQDVSIPAARIMARDFENGVMVPEHIYTLCMARISRETIAHSSIEKALSKYADDFGYGPLARKLLERMGRISRGEFDHVNKSREEVHGFGQMVSISKPVDKKKPSQTEKKLSKTATGKVQKKPFKPLQNKAMKAYKSTFQMYAPTRKPTWEELF